MTVRELINKLTYCDMDAEVEIQTSNVNNEGRHYVFTLDDVDPNPIFNAIDCRKSIRFMFEDWRLNK